MADLRSKEDDALPPLPVSSSDQHHAADAHTPHSAVDAASPVATENAPPAAKSSVDGEHSAVLPALPGQSASSAPPHSASSNSASQPPVLAAAAPNPEQLKQVEAVLESDIGVSTLLNRLKHSIASAREFAIFLKKRATLEEDSAQSIKKMSRMTHETMHRPEYRQGTFAHAYDEMTYIHERMAENGANFAASLHQMHDDLVEFASGAERSRKNWKTNALSAEHKVADLEQTMRKSKAKYDSLADDYDRVRTGETRQTGKVFNAFKNKSSQQQEEDLRKKVQAADQAYHGHVQTLKSEKSHLESTTRPEAIKAINHLIREIDAGLSLQMQKFAAFNEKLLLSNGLSISPIQGPGGGSSGGGASGKSLRHAVMAIDNDKDLNDYVSAQFSKVPATSAEIKYERNPVLNPPPSHAHSQSMSQQPQPQSQPQPPLSSHPSQLPTSGPSPGGFGGHQTQQNFGVMPQGQYNPPQTTGLAQNSSVRSSIGGFGSGPMQMQNSLSAGLKQPYPPIGSSQNSSQPFSPHNRSFSHGNMLQQHLPPNSVGPQQQQQQQPSSPYGAPSHGNQSPHQMSGMRSPQGAGPPQLGSLPFQPQGSHPLPSAPSYQLPSSSSHPAMGPRDPSPAHGPPYQTPPSPQKPVFAVHLSRLYERDGVAVPMVVHQCIQAVDLFGLGVEGIYRQSGSKNHIDRIKHMFDTESNSKALDFRNPEKFYHDVNSVTGLLKQFLRELPDPLLTFEHHDGFIAAAKHEDDILRRDSLHAIINSLPDPNYATLRALCLHLHRVIDNAHVNRMDSQNLAVIFGPTLMGTDPSKAIADAGWQIKVIDTILQNTYQIFDED